MNNTNNLKEFLEAFDKNIKNYKQRDVSLQSIADDLMKCEDIVALSKENKIRVLELALLKIIE